MSISLATKCAPISSPQIEVADDIRIIFNTPDRPTSKSYLAREVAKYADKTSRHSAWMEKSSPETVAIFWLSKKMIVKTAKHQWLGTSEPRNQAESACDTGFPKRGIVLAIDQCDPDED